MKLTLLWFENAEPGTAAGQHLTGTLQRLDEEGIVPSEVIAAKGSDGGGLRGKIRRLVGLQFAGARRTAKDQCLLVRWHPAALPVLALHRLRGGHSVLLVQGNSADMHAAYPLTRFLPLDALLIRPSLSMGTVHVAPNPGIIAWATSEVGAKVTRSFVVENGFDGDAVAAVEPLTDLELAEHCLRRKGYAVFVGKFATWQGIPTLLKAVSSDHWPSDLPLVFVGDGAELPRVLDAAELNPLVRYVGRVVPEVALAWTEGAAVALAARNAGPASDRGVSPYKVLEASGLGTPLVATKVKGQRELVEDLGSGVLVDPEDARQLAHAVGTLWRDDALRYRLAERGGGAARALAWRARSQDLVTALRAAGWTEENHA